MSTATIAVLAPSWNTGAVEIIPSPWIQVKDGNPVARALFSRHYTYNRKREQMSFFAAKNRNYKHFVGPGEKMVLLTPDESAMFVWRKFRSMDNQAGVNCAVFRNEGKTRSSDLIRAAMRWAWLRWPGERLYTYVNPGAVRSRNPGYCFIAAGWRRCGATKAKGLLILEVFDGATSTADSPCASEKRA